GARRDVTHLHGVVAALGPELERGRDHPLAARSLALGELLGGRGAGHDDAEGYRSADRPPGTLTSGRGSAGNPSTRSPMMLRCTSFVPPAMPLCGAHTNR